MNKLIRYLIYSVYLTLAGSGLVYLCAGMAGRSPWAGVGLLAAASFLGYAVSGYVKRGTAVAAVAAAALMIAANLFLLPYGGWNVLLGLFGAVAVIVGARHNWKEEDRYLIDLHLLTAGLVIDAAMFIIAVLNGCDAPQPQIGYTTYVFICMTILLVNRRSIQLNAGTQAKRMMHSNQILAWGFVGVFSLAVFFGPLQRWVSSAIRWAIVAFFDLFNKEQPPGDFVPTDGGGNEDLDLSFLDGDVKEWPTWVQVLSDIFLYTVTIVVVLALLGFLIWAMIRAGKEFGQYLKNWFATFGSAGNEEFSEESEQLMTAQSMREQFAEDFKRRVKKIFERPVRWNALTPNERVRHVYRHLLEQEKRISPSAENLTPQQLCERAEKDAQFAALYGKVRYAEKDVSAQDAENYRAYLKG